ncbi:MAG: hypothetical protein K0U52_07365 [Gammaproteobacteria bacterium]|nr:hypothetical protein [Gammaproteobacteria bacterium]
MLKNYNMQFRTKRNIDISVWYAEKIMENYSDPYDAIEWLVMHLGSDAFQTIAEIYDDEFSNEIELSKQRQSQYKGGVLTKRK